MHFISNLLARATPDAVPAQRIKPNVRVHKDTDLVVYADQNLHYVINLYTGPGMPDGVALCPKMHEVPLMHWGGDHPLRHVTCKRCSGSVYNEATWSATPILLPVKEATVKDTILRLPTAADSYGRICCRCSQSHRASSPGFDGQCQCGMAPSSLDVYFYLGSPNSFRRDPQAVIQAARIKHVQAAHQRHPNERPSALVEDNRFDVTLKRLPRSNARGGNGKRRPVNNQPRTYAATVATPPSARSYLATTTGSSVLQHFATAAGWHWSVWKCPHSSSATLNMSPIDTCSASHSHHHHSPCYHHITITKAKGFSLAVIHTRHAQDRTRH
jgi:hypothetical protein